MFLCRKSVFLFPELQKPIIMENLKDKLKAELEERILPFWAERMQDPEGGFYGRIDGKGRLDATAPRGAILNARILWTFSSACRVLGDKRYLEVADKAYNYIRDHFIDKEYGGVYWSLDADGKPLEDKKQFYAIAFTIYALAEYSRVCSDPSVLDLAVSLYRDIETHSLDADGKGYLEACTREWGEIADMRLSDKDQNDARTMNTHLHILEAYAGLYRVWKTPEMKASLRRVIDIFLDRIIREDGHLGLFFGEDWTPHSTAFSYGHDIETSWLLYEAAEVLGESDVIERMKAVSTKMAVAALEGFTAEGGMEYEYDPADGHRNPSRDWWVQAETVVGCVNQYQLTSDKTWLEKAGAQWDFIEKYILCPDGEWYWGVTPCDGGFTPDTDNDRAGFWKCPYHNGRMCMEIIERCLSLK